MAMDTRTDSLQVTTQGFGLRISLLQVSKPAFKEALMAVLTNPKYTMAAQAISVRIRARKNTPAQEAAGTHSLLLGQASAVLSTSNMQYLVSCMRPV